MFSDFQEVFMTLTAKAAQYKGKTLTEEATKHFLILPFIAALGYDIFDIAEVMPEFTADIGIRQKERIDYAILKDGKPIILIECKPVSSNLTVQNEGQLFRYFQTCDARFAVLTNGMQYKFYTDSEKNNVMDTTPFFELDLNNSDISSLSILESFRKEKFNMENLLGQAKNLKHITLAREVVSKELQVPSNEMIHLIASKMYPNTRFTERFKKELSPIICSAFSSTINSRIRAALDTTLDTVGSNEEDNFNSIQKKEIITTQDEYDAFYTIRGICVELIAPERVVMRDAKSYCAVLFDDNNRMPIARLYFNNLNKLMLGIFRKKNEEKVIISNIREIYMYKDDFLQTVRKYLKK